MKFGSFLVACLLLTGCASTAHIPETPDSVPRGDIARTQLMDNHVKFAENFESYQVDTAAIENINLDDNSYEIVILMGTWCHDSVREVPRMLKILDALNFTESQVRMIGLDYRKSEPMGREKTYDLRFTPTFVVLRDGEEIGRIIERPEQSLEVDLAAILSR